MPLPTIDELMNTEVGAGFGEAVPAGYYSGVITGAEVHPGGKGPYIKLEVTIHDEDYKGRKVWKNAISFSEKALGMPGGVVQLLQVVQPTLDRSLPSEELPAAIAEAVLTAPVVVEIGHEQVKRQGAAQFNADGSPEMRAQIDSFLPPEDDFVAAVAKEAAGVDSDLPF